jgi:hypothetical protein
VYGDFEDLETGEKRTGEESKQDDEEEEEAPRIVDYGGDAAREKGLQFIPLPYHRNLKYRYRTIAI